VSVPAQVRLRQGDQDAPYAQPHDTQIVALTMILQRQNTRKRLSTVRIMTSPTVGSSQTELPSDSTAGAELGQQSGETGTMIAQATRS